MPEVWFRNSAGKSLVVSPANPLPVTGGGGGGGGGDASAANQALQIAAVGATNDTAATTDTGTFSLLALTKRLLAKLTAQLPAALGTAADAASLPVALSTEGKAQVGGLTETAPATDTASSGLNGRLQRIAQRLTSLIALQAVATATTSSVASSITSVQLLAANASRALAVVVNDSASATLKIKLGTTVSATDYTYSLNPGDAVELRWGSVAYTGRIDGIWSAAVGSARITEM